MLKRNMLIFFFKTLRSRFNYERNAAEYETYEAKACRERMILKAVRKYLREHTYTKNHSYSDRKKREN